MKGHQTKIFWLGLLLLGLAAGCNGSGSSRADITGTGDGETASDDGEVQGFGSVIVNGTHYETNAATVIEVDGQPATEADLALGMMVSVDVPAADLGRDGAIARRIVFRSALIGPIDAISGDTLTVIGVQVHTDALTRFFDLERNPVTLASFATGDTVQISGLRRSDGGLTATFVRQTPPRDSSGLVVRGRISQFSSASMRFMLGDLLVDYSAAASIETIDQLENGDFVDVRGRPAGGQFMASRVTELRDAQGGDNSDRPERGGVQGQVHDIDPSSACPNLRFFVNDQAVAVNSSTRFDGGACGDIADQRRVGVIGRFADAGSLVAEGLVFAPEIDAALLAPVQSITFSDNFGRQCVLRVLGDLDVIVSSNTRQAAAPPRDSSGSAGPRGLGCGEVRVGDFIHSAGIYDPQTNLFEAAILLGAGPSERMGPFQNLAAAGGRVSAKDEFGPSFTVLGTRILTSNDTDFGEDQFAARFFLNLNVGEFAGGIGEFDGVDTIQAFAVRRGFDYRFEE